MISPYRKQLELNYQRSKPSRGPQIFQSIVVSQFTVILSCHVAVFIMKIELLFFVFFFVFVFIYLTNILQHKNFISQNFLLYSMIINFIPEYFKSKMILACYYAQLPLYS